MKVSVHLKYTMMQINHNIIRDTKTLRIVINLLSKLSIHDEYYV